MVRAEYALTSHAAGTFRTGYIYSSKKDDGQGLAEGVDVIPFWAGAKSFVVDLVYIGAEFGLTVLRWKADYWGEPVSDTSAKFGVGVGTGIEIGRFRVGLQAQLLDMGHVSDYLALNAGVGWNFY